MNRSPLRPTKSLAMRRCVFAPIAVGLIIATVTIVARFRWYESHCLQEAVAARIDTASKTFVDDVQDDAELIDTLTDIVASDPRLQQLYLAGDRYGLLKAARPMFEDLRSKHKITHFYFDDASGVCFLRVHDPQRATVT